MKLTLHHVNYCTSNVEAMDDFYRNVLELEQEKTMGPMRAQTSEGYNGKVSFVTDGAIQMHLAEKDFGAAFRTKNAINPVERGHIAFRTDDIDAFKKKLDARGIPYSDYGSWAINGWQQIFFHDPDGNIIEVHQAGK